MYIFLLDLMTGIVVMISYFPTCCALLSGPFNLITSNLYKLRPFLGLQLLCIFCLMVDNILPAS
jgi:hypothetical protein